MAMYKLTYLGWGESHKEVFPNSADCNMRKKFLKGYPKEQVSELKITKINDAFHISYSKLGTEDVPDQWRYGEIVRYKSVPKWYDGYEEWAETEQEMLDFVKLMKSITNKTYGKFIVEHIVNDMVVSTANF
jgi:hypothetical protein